RTECRSQRIMRQPTRRSACPSFPRALLLFQRDSDRPLLTARDALERAMLLLVTSRHNHLQFHWLTAQRTIRSWTSDARHCLSPSPRRLAGSRHFIVVNSKSPPGWRVRRNRDRKHTRSAARRSVQKNAPQPGRQKEQHDFVLFAYAQSPDAIHPALANCFF